MVDDGWWKLGSGLSKQTVESGMLMVEGIQGMVEAEKVDDVRLMMEAGRWRVKGG